MFNFVGVLCQAKPQYDAVKEMMDDPEFNKTALGIVRIISSAETLCQRKDDIGSSLRW